MIGTKEWYAKWARMSVSNGLNCTRHALSSVVAKHDPKAGELLYAVEEVRVQLGIYLESCGVTPVLTIAQLEAAVTRRTGR